MTRDWRRAPWYLRHRLGPRWVSELRRQAVHATHLHADVRITAPVRIGPGFALEIPDRGTFHVAEACDFRRGFVCEIAGDGRVVIGPHCTFTSHALVQCSTSIRIGERCVFGQDLLLADGNHRFRDPDRHLLDQGYEFRPIVIGDGAVVTSKCTILASVGERALIGANSVVTKPVPAYCLAVGAPARVVEYFGPPELRPAELGELDV